MQGGGGGCVGQQLYKQFLAGNQRDFPGPCNVLSLKNATRAKFIPNLPMLQHCNLRALSGSVEKNTDSLVKRMILFDQEGEGGAPTPQNIE